MIINDLYIAVSTLGLPLPDSIEIAIECDSPKRPLGFTNR